jgi:WD40 repeat protein
MVFTPDSRTLIAGIRGGEKGSPAAVRSWHVATGKPGRAWTEDRTLGLILAVSPDGKTLATVNENGVIRLWDRASGAERRPAEASPCSLQAVGFRAGGKTVVTVGADLAVRQWDAATGRLLGRPRPLGKDVFYPLFISGEKPLLAVVVWDARGNPQVRLHDLADGRLVLEQPGYSPVLSRDGRRLALGGKNGIRVLDLPMGKVVRTLAVAAEGGGDDRQVDGPRGFSPDGRSLVVQGESVSVWDLATGRRKSSWGLREHKVLTGPARPGQHSWERIEAVVLSPDGRTIAFSLVKDSPGRRPPPREWFGRLMLFDTATGKLLHQVDTEDEVFEHLAFSPDGKLLAGGGPWTVRLWDVAGGREVRQWEGHRGRVTSLAFSPDGRRLASASEDSTVLVWDVAR